MEQTFEDRVKEIIKESLSLGIQEDSADYGQSVNSKNFTVSLLFDGEEISTAWFSVMEGESIPYY